MSRHNSVTLLGRVLTRVLAVMVCLLGTVEVFGGGDAWARPQAMRPIATLDVYADLDGDGRVDVVRARDDSNTIDIISSSHHRHRRRHLDAAAPLLGLIATDIDRDGDADLVALNRAGTLTVWINCGHGRFRREQPRPPTEATRPIAALDLSGLATGLPVAYVSRTRLELEGVAAAADARVELLPAETIPRRLTTTYSSVAFETLATRGPPRLLLRA